MTDREKMIDMLRTACDSGKDCSIPCFECVANHFVSNGVTLQNWIPVSERLPEVGTGNVLVARSYKGKPYVDVGEFINGTACCWGDEYAINPREHITTHWMPLPEPPKEEDK